MSFSTGTLGNYTKENADKLLTGVIMKGVTAARMKAKGTVIPNIKTSQKIGKITTDAVYQDGANCGWNASGSTVISQREITVGAIKVMEAFCNADLEAKFTQQALPAGSNYDTLMFEEEIVDQKTRKINYQNDLAIWKGDTDSAVHYLSRFNGLLKSIDADPTVIVANSRTGTGTISAVNNDPTVTGVGTLFTTELAVGDKVYSGTTLLGVVDSITSATALELTANAAATVNATVINYVPANSPFFAAPITAVIGLANVLSIIDGVYLAIPEEIKADVEAPVIRLGCDVAGLIKVALKNANLYHSKPDMKPTDSFMFPGLDIEVQPTPGLSGTGRIIVAQDINLWLGTDLEDEENEVKVWYSQDNEEMRMKFRWKMGTNYGFGNQIVSYKRLA